ncbi:hypothetical protein QVD17_10907 [Tagetes erecta]|uniref:Transmembrane protein n=1 Tax=Tagetes erecta TaxID=13708 RepID=A0AAD8L486_TARER|nr:hypothetical protein QVD17_10907 [Tagetes erecta]
MLAHQNNLVAHQHSKSLPLLQESRRLETVRLGGDKESMDQDMVTLAKGSKGGRAAGGSGGTINHTPRKSKAPNEAPYRVLGFGLADHNKSIAYLLPSKSKSRVWDSYKFHPTSMAFRATNLVKSMMNRSTGSHTFATSTTAKIKSIKGAYAPVYISLGLILMSVSIGAFTATHQLKRSPNVSVKKSKRETLSELVEPEKVAEESDDFIKKSFFRKIAHVQDADRQEIMPDPIRGDTYAKHPEPYTETLKSVGVDVEKKPFVQPPPLKH